MQTTLYFREGGSDKVYWAALELINGGWMVHYAYGRRGATLTAGAKTPQPTTKAKARKIYDQLIAGKQAKGYTAGEDGTPYSGESVRDTGVRPQLLNAVEEEEVAQLLADHEFLLQPKLDGKRLLLRKAGTAVTGINRRGLESGVPDTIRQNALALPGDFLVDGEAVGDTLHVFDLLERDGRDFRPLPYKQRLETLIYLLAEGNSEYLQWVPTFRGGTMRHQFKKMRSENLEGVVFKRVYAPYTPGRPSSGGDQLKFKFVKTASVIVSAINNRRSVAISLMDDTKQIPAGNVTIPANQEIPQIGQVAEVRYLYALPDSGALFQPVYLGVREDIVPGECQHSQLQYKAA